MKCIVWVFVGCLSSRPKKRNVCNWKSCSAEYWSHAGLRGELELLRYPATPALCETLSGFWAVSSPRLCKWWNSLNCFWIKSHDLDSHRANLRTEEAIFIYSFFRGILQHWISWLVSLYTMQTSARLRESSDLSRLFSLARWEAPALKLNYKTMYLHD